ncbi:cyclic nucleotide-binding protein [Kouleothrix aurantiaca]|uniref:Cyclic nucleotide-binding protein n=1 Tax=Kouleothrix aurantiaca TaxID=186479 RepID=A0A0P9DAQ5_9CHLR|nr:cyclic nucleotide-binding protein [Kouleothrix aurantiaca]
MATYTINGQVLYVQEAGPAHGPIAILIHGWSSSSFTWAPIIPILSKRYRCIAIDLPGFGQSPAPDNKPTIVGYADLIAQIIVKLNGDHDRAVLVLGHSMGGQIATTLALLYPVLVDKLVLLNPALSGRLSTRVNLLMKPHVMAERSSVIEWLLYMASKTPLDYTDYLLKPSNFAERAHVSEQAYAKIREDARRRGQGQVRAACFVAMQQGDLRGQLGRVEPQTLVLWGAEDNIVPLRDAGAVAEEWPRADLRLIPNAGHWPQFEQTDATLRHIAHFLGLPPTLGDRPVETDNDLAHLQEIAAFLNNSEIGEHLTEAQRLRLASLVLSNGYGSGENVVAMNSNGDEMYIVKEGTLEVWLTTDSGTTRLASMNAGQVAGELALLEGVKRSAELRAGPQGAHLLVLTKEVLDGLAEDDPAMGMRMMQNLAISLGKRLRLQNWRAARAEENAPGLPQR